MLITWALYTGALLLVAQVLRGFEIRGGLWAVISVAALFGVLNWALNWAITFLLGLFTLSLAWALGIITQIVVVAIVLKITDAVSDRLKIRGFGVALIAATVIEVVRFVGHELLL